ncbi:MAG: DegT/DnrJ/EryC1/StrS family aminotransferase [Bacteroidia bacterium]
MLVPFVDLKPQYHSLKKDIDSAILSVIENTNFIGGEPLTSFENSFAKACGTEHCIGVGNGTDALYIILKSLGITSGDEVITVANSWISTSETISQCGAKPVFVDIEPDYYSIDVNKIEEKITTKTKAVIPVHLYGQMAEIEKIATICKRHNLFLIEDCAQAHLAEFKAIKAGRTGIASAFSFYPGKNLGAYGDGGAIITNDDTLAIKMRMFANHGALVKHQHRIEGINSRLDTIQAAILNVKLPHLQKWNEQRLKNALLYNQLLSDVSEITTPKIRSEAKHIFHLYVIRAEKRNELMSYLSEKGIQTQIHYPTILPLLPAYNYLNHKAQDFPVAASYQGSILSLPMFPELTEEQIKFVAESIKAFYK